MNANVTIICLVLACCASGVALAAELLHNGEFEPEFGGAQMRTNVALVGSKEALGKLSSERQQNLAVVDPTGVLDGISKSAALGDIEEDPSDRFITTRSGKRRPSLVGDESEWAEEAPIIKARKLAHEPRVLTRKRRCGGGSDDDDGDARRSRRARRARRARRTRRARKAAARRSAATTTVTRKVIQNGQVVSQTTETQGGAVLQQQQQPGQVLVQQQQPMVQAAPQPVVVQQQPAQQVVAAQPAAAAVQGVPSIAVTGSVKVN